MTDKNKMNKSLDDILFEKRNKAYGAYDLRKKYRNNMLKALSVALIIAAIGSLFMFFVKNEPLKEKVKVTKVKLEKKQKKKLPPPPPPPPPTKEVIEQIKEELVKQTTVQQVVQQIEVVQTSSGEGKGEGNGNGPGPGGGGGECLYPTDLDGDGLTCDDACPKNAGPASNKGCPPLNPDDYDASRVYAFSELKTVVNVKGAECDLAASNPKQYLCFRNKFKELLMDIYSNDISFRDDVLAGLEAMGITDISQNTSATRAKRTVDLDIVIEKDGSITITNITGQSPALKNVAKQIFMELNKPKRKYLLPGIYQKSNSISHPARMKYNHSIEFSYEE